MLDDCRRGRRNERRLFDDRPQFATATMLSGMLSEILSSALRWNQTMRIVDLISQELEVDFPHIMLLRHSTGSIKLMEAAGVTVEEFTSLQPPNSKWDFWRRGKPKIDVVVTIVRDRVESVFRVLNIDAEGNLFSIVTRKYRKFDASRGNTEDRPILRFRLKPIECTALGAPITGWEGKEISPVLRRSTPLFWQIEVAVDSAVRLPDAHGGDEEPFVLEESDRRRLVERQIRERRGQQAFREQLLQRCGGRCMVTKCTTLAVLEAAHITPYRGESDNHPENGLLLRSDIHTLFDLDLLGIRPVDLKVVLHPDLAKQRDYKSLAGRKLLCTARKRPSKPALDMRYEQFQAKLNNSE